MAAVISNQDYAAGGPFAYVREGGTAAWSRHRSSLGRARLSGRKMYPNNTMRAELESRLRCLKEKGSSNRFMRKKAEDLEEMLATVDRSELEKRLLHLKKVSIAVPSSVEIKKKIAEVERVLGAATNAGTTKTECVISPPRMRMWKLPHSSPPPAPWKLTGTVQKMKEQFEPATLPSPSSRNLTRTSLRIGRSW